MSLGASLGRCSLEPKQANSRAQPEQLETLLQTNFTDSQTLVQESQFSCFYRYNIASVLFCLVLRPWLEAVSSLLE